METLFPHGFWHYLLGGLVIGAGVSFLFVSTGLIGGASTFFSSTCSFVSRHAFFAQERLVGSRGWRVIYALGMLLGGVAFALFAGASSTEVTWWQLLIGGLVAGFGARMANGCTSGHGICGLASLQLPSLLAVLTFMATAFAAANLMPLLGGR